MSEVISVNEQTGIVVLTATDVEAVPGSELGQPNGVATLDSGGLLPSAQLPSSVATSSSAFAQMFVTTSGSDANSGRSSGQAKATIKGAIEALEALEAKTGLISLGGGRGASAFVHTGGATPIGLTIRGISEFLTEVKLAAGANANVFQDASWGSPTSSEGYLQLEHLTVNGNREEQGSSAGSTSPSALVSASTSVTSAGVTVPLFVPSEFPTWGIPAAKWLAGAPFPASGECWIGEHRCTYTGYTAPSAEGTSGSLTGVKPYSGTTFTATPEMLVLPAAGAGHGIALQSPRSVVDHVIVKECEGNGIACQGPVAGSPNYVFQQKLDHFECNNNGRYGIEIIGPRASDGMIDNYVGSGNNLGALNLCSQDWKVGKIHAVGKNYGYAGNSPQLVRICAGLQRITDLTLDYGPYDGVRIDTLSLATTISDVDINGLGEHACSASAQAGALLCVYGEGTLAVQRFKMAGAYPGRWDDGVSPFPRTYTIGVQNLKAISEAAGKVQMLNALTLSPTSAIGGKLTIGAEEGSYLGSTSATTCLVASAAIGATELKVEGLFGLATSGTVTVDRNPGLGTTSASALRIAYTELVSSSEGHFLKGVTGVTEELPAGTGVAQHFITGVTGYAGTAVADGTIAYQNGRKILHLDGELDIRTSNMFQSSPEITSAANLRLRGEINGKPNPFYGTVTIAVGETNKSVAHGFSVTPQFYGATPEADPQQRWYLEAGSTNLTIHVTSAIATSPVVFQVWAANTYV